MNIGTAELAKVVFTYPAIDNHAHPLLKPAHRDQFPFEGLISEASDLALTNDAVHTLACYRATGQLAKLYKLPGDVTWEGIKDARRAMDYETLCRLCFEPTRIQSILLDDGLGGVSQYCEDYKWHNKFTPSPSKRIVRVETVAETILKEVSDVQIPTGIVNPYCAFLYFEKALIENLTRSAKDPEVAGFKSIVCYRTGLDVSVEGSGTDVERLITMVILRYELTKTVRLVDKPINDFIVNTTLRIAGEYGKPVQFHTGLGDNDITLTLSNPSLMQPLIKAHPNTKIVLLHASYPFTREAGYLTAMYRNVYLDFGEIFPILSAEGQVDVVKQVLELCPTNKIMWSTDGHWWPESYYLGTQQAREALFKVLSDSVHWRTMTESQAIGVAKRALFDNANEIYGLGLQPQWSS